MSGFKTREGDFAVVVTNGVYKQVPVAERGGYLFAAVSGGYVRLNVDGSTSKDKLRLDELNVVDEIAMDVMGRLGVPGAIPRERPLPDDRSAKLGLAPSTGRLSGPDG